MRAGIVPGVADGFGAVDVAGSVVVAISERLGGTVELTIRGPGGAHLVAAFVEPLAFTVLSLLDVPLSAATVSADDPWIPQVCAALGEEPAAYRLLALVDAAGQARFRMVARDATWR